jgi:HlyD family secretion protein
MNRKIVLIIGLVVLLIIFFYQVFLKDKNPEFDLVEVARGTVSQEIFETGQIGKGEKINLTFGNAGRIEEIYVEVGDDIKQGQELAKLDTADLEIQLQEARISLELAQLNLNKLLAGSSPEEIKVVQSQTENARISFAVAQENLENSYDDALIVLDASYPQIYNALSFIKEFIEEYISVYDQNAKKIMDARTEVSEAEKQAKTYLAAAKEESAESESIDQALSTMRNSLKTTFDGLEVIRAVIDDSVVYKNNVSSSDKTSLDTLKTNANSAMVNIVASQQAISLRESSLETARTSLEEAENRLSLITAESRQVDIDLYQAQIRQAQARVLLYENQLSQSRLASPLSGKIAEINKRVGELVQPALQDAVMIILPEIPYEIKANIYEEDVVKITLGNPVDITLVAFPGKTFTGRIVSISPAEKLVDGVVYYEVIVGLDEAPEGIKPGMSADIVIKTNSKDNVLIVPEEAIMINDARNFVEVFVDGRIEERDVEVGLEGTSDDMVEIISGLGEGEKVILR